MTLLRGCQAALLCLFASTASAATVTLEDATLYRDLATGVPIVLPGFDTGPSAFGPATLTVRYGLWNGPGTATVSLMLMFNGNALSPVTVNDGYYSTPTTFSWDVSSLITAGLNSLGALGNTLSEDTSYAVGEISLTYETSAATSDVPLPASLPLALLALGTLGLANRRRTA